MFGRLSSQPLLITRSTLGLIGVLLNIYAIDHMVLSDADSLMKLNPFWTILLSIVFLHEKVRKYQITAMIIAILGMLLIVKPEFSSSMIPSLAGLFSGIFAAAAYTCVRALSTREAPYTIVFYFSLFSVIVLIPFTAYTYEPMSQMQILYLLGAGLAAAVGQIGVTLAYSLQQQRYFYFHVCIYNFHSNTWIYSIRRISRFLCNIRLRRYYRCKLLHV